MDHPVTKPVFRREDQRGVLIEAINTGSWGAMLIGDMRAGSVVGNHYHEVTSVYVFLVDGLARVELRDVKTGGRSGYDLAAGHGTLLGPGVSHAIRFLEPSRYVMLKSRPYHPDDPDTFHLMVEDVDANMSARR
jgi:quercetin dioxygenase-like cupin family protein